MITIEYDLTPEQAVQILEPDGSNPLNRLMKRMTANQMAQMATRLAGPTTVELTEEGVLVTVAGSEQQIAWSCVRRFNERPQAWVLLLAPSGLCVIPAGAVPPARIPEVTAFLRAKAEGKYKVRNGGLPHLPLSQSPAA
ncbi:MAG TPA: YcxB family protein [Actinocrinis sp.]|nr:YcxB family protein [Actinocrinis sp.]